MIYLKLQSAGWSHGMGRHLSLATMLAWQAATFLSGLFAGGTVFKGHPKAHWLERVIKSTRAQRKDPAEVPSSLGFGGAAYLP